MQIHSVSTLLGKLVQECSSGNAILLNCILGMHLQEQIQDLGCSGLVQEEVRVYPLEFAPHPQ